MSDLKFACQNCGQPILVAATEAGRKLTCPSCKTQLTIPKAQPASGEPGGDGSELKIADTATAPAPTGPPLAAPENVTLPPLPSTSGEPAALPVPPAEGKSSLRLEPAETPAQVASVHAAAELRRALAPEPSAAPELNAAAEAEPTAEPTANAVPATPSPPQEVSEAPAPVGADASQPVQIAVLSSELKRGIVEAARKLIADASRWLPGVDDNGKLLYAAMQVKDQWKPLEPGSDEATHHSLMGSVLRELHRRNVAPTAAGRTKFLDDEIPDAIRKVVHEEVDATEGDESPKARAARFMTISHAQCLEVLDLLERDYAAQAAAEVEAPARSESRGASLDELLVRAARDEVVTVTELLRAVHAELVGLNHRLTRLEKGSGDSAPAAPAKQAGEQPLSSRPARWP